MVNGSKLIIPLFISCRLMKAKTYPDTPTPTQLQFFWTAGNCGHQLNQLHSTTRNKCSCSILNAYFVPCARNTCHTATGDIMLPILQIRYLMLSEDNLLNHTELIREGARTGARVCKLSETGPLTKTYWLRISGQVAKESAFLLNTHGGVFCILEPENPCIVHE